MPWLVLLILSLHLAVGFHIPVCSMSQLGDSFWSLIHWQAAGSGSEDRTARTAAQQSSAQRSLSYSASQPAFTAETTEAVHHSCLTSICAAQPLPSTPLHTHYLSDCLCSCNSYFHLLSLVMSAGPKDGKQGESSLPPAL